MSSTVCIDASLALMWLLPAEQNEAANTLRREWYKNDIQIITAPYFMPKLPRFSESKSILTGSSLKKGKRHFQPI